MRYAREQVGALKGGLDSARELVLGLEIALQWQQATSNSSGGSSSKPARLSTRPGTKGPRRSRGCLAPARQRRPFTSEICTRLPHAPPRLADYLTLHAQKRHTQPSPDLLCLHRFPLLSFVTLTRVTPLHNPQSGLQHLRRPRSSLCPTMNRLFGGKSNAPKPTLNDAIGNVRDVWPFLQFAPQLTCPGTNPPRQH